MRHSATGLGGILLFIGLLPFPFRARGQALHRVTFRVESITLPDSAGGAFFLASSCNGWNPADPAFLFSRADSGWVGLDLWLKEGSLEYKITRGNWKQVECAADGHPIANRRVEIRGDTLIRIQVAGWSDLAAGAPPVHTRSPRVQLLDTAFRMPQLNRTRRIWIYLPRDYQLSAKRYPVVYMQDGQNLFDDATAYSGEWGVDECLDTLGLSCIVVGIDNGGAKRMNEYAPFDMPQYGPGEGKQYAAFLVKVLKPYIDAHFRTRLASANTFIAGSSMGGLIAAYLLARYRRVFGGAGIFSPAFWVNTGIFKTLQEAAPGIHGPIFLFGGDKESETMVPDLKKAADLLGKPAYGNLLIQIKPGGRHNEASWRSALPAFFNWILRRTKN